MKNISKILLLLAGMSLVFLSFKSSCAFEISGGASYAGLDISGKGKSHGTDIDLKGDLSMKEDEPAGILLKIEGERHHLFLEFASIQFEGAVTLTKQFEFRDKIYTIGAKVDSDLEFDLWEIQYHYDLLDLQDETEMIGFSLSPLIKVSVYNGSLNIKSTTLGFDESYKEILPIPTAGILARLDLTKYLNLTAQANGIGYSGDTYIEYKGVVELRPIEWLGIGGGYKSINIEYSDTENILDLDTEGFFVQSVLTYRF